MLVSEYTTFGKVLSTAESILYHGDIRARYVFVVREINGAIDIYNSTPREHWADDNTACAYNAVNTSRVLMM